VRYITYCNHAILVSTVSHSQFPGLPSVSCVVCCYECR